MLGKSQINQKLNAAGYNWLFRSDKYIRVGEIQEPRYWIAPFADEQQHAVNEKYAKSFQSLKEIEEFLNER